MKSQARAKASNTFTILGPIDLEFSTFSVEGRSDLNMMVYSPANTEVTEQFRSLVTSTC